MKPSHDLPITSAGLCCGPRSSVLGNGKNVVSARCSGKSRSWSRFCLQPQTCPAGNGCPDDLTSMLRSGGNRSIVSLEYRDRRHPSALPWSDMFGGRYCSSPIESGTPGVGSAMSMRGAQCSLIVQSAEAELPFPSMHADHCLINVSHDAPSDQPR